MKPDFREEMERSAQEIYEEIDRYLQSAILGYGAERKRRWRADDPSDDACVGSPDRNRARLIDVLGGFPDWKLEPRARCEGLFETDFCTGYSVEFDVLPGVRSRGILTIPKYVELPTAAVMTQHGYVSAPETVLGLRAPGSVYHGYGLALARRGYVVFAHKNLSFKQPRSQVHRKATLIGQTLLGMDVFQTSRVIDYLQTLPEVDPERIGMYGISQGGMTTLYAAACDPRIAASVVCAYFNDRTPKMVVSGGNDYTAFIDTDELDKDVHGLLDFTDPELAELICPRPLLIEAGRRDGACHWRMVVSEFAKVRGLYGNSGVDERVELDLHDGGHEIHGLRSFPFLDRWLKPSKVDRGTEAEHSVSIPGVEARVDRIQRETCRELDGYFDDLILGYGPHRAKRWKRDYGSLAAYEASVGSNRERLLEMLAVAPDETAPLDPVLEPFAQWPECDAFRVTLNVLAGVTARGILLLPKAGGGPSPAVIAQHGMGGDPEAVLGLIEDDPYYHGFGRKLAGLGYVVFAHKVVSYPEQRPRLHRKALLIGKTLLGLEILKFRRVVDFLASLPGVDADRIGMYGLSQGGLSTLYAAAADRRIRAAVCAAYFNERTPKMIVSDDRYTAFIDTPEHDKFIHGHLAEFSDWDLASLICPRPFMVEAGRGDGAVYWPMLLAEFARVREVYARLGIAERTEVHLHELDHEIHGARSFEFLDRWLKRG